MKPFLAKAPNNSTPMEVDEEVLPNQPHNGQGYQPTLPKKRTQNGAVEDAPPFKVASLHDIRLPHPQMEDNFEERSVSPDVLHSLQYDEILTNLIGTPEKMEDSLIGFFPSINARRFDDHDGVQPGFEYIQSQHERMDPFAGPPSLDLFQVNEMEERHRYPIVQATILKLNKVDVNVSPSEEALRPEAVKDLSRSPSTLPFTVSYELETLDADGALIVNPSEVAFGTFEGIDEYVAEEFDDVASETSKDGDDKLVEETNEVALETVEEVIENVEIEADKMIIESFENDDFSRQDEQKEDEPVETVMNTVQNEEDEKDVSVPLPASLLLSSTDSIDQRNVQGKRTRKTVERYEPESWKSSRKGAKKRELKKNEKQSVQKTTKTVNAAPVKKTLPKKKPASRKPTRQEKRAATIRQSAAKAEKEEIRLKNARQEKRNKMIQDRLTRFLKRNGV